MQLNYVEIDVRLNFVLQMTVVKENEMTKVKMNNGRQIISKVNVNMWSHNLFLYNTHQWISTSTGLFY